MKLGDPFDDRIPWIRRVHDLDDARASISPGARVEAIRGAGRALGDELRAGARVHAVKTLPITPLVYPTRFAFNGVVPLPWPYVVMTHRCLLVQLETEEGIKNLLFNPTDPEASQAGTPFFRNLLESMSSLGPLTESVIKRGNVALVDQLAELGLGPSDIDVIAFDHFHTQDLRPILGTGAGDRGRFPNALLLAPRSEWEQWGSLHPMQRAWFVADGNQGVPSDRVVLTDHDAALAQGALLLRTPGHTVGNQTIFVHADEGVFGCCENGCSADSWSPRASSIPGLRSYAETYDVEVVLNSNTPEFGGAQYESMILERSVVDAVPDRPDMVQMFPSSEVTPSAIAPALKPTMVFAARDGGRVTRPSARS
jgi:glyoxylase-like metal-dependent hydrolase (beta-lactamase superfamily II)